MFKFLRSCSLFAVAASLFAVTAHAQTVTPLQRQLSRIDLGISAPFEFTRTTSGSTPASFHTLVTVNPSTSAGYMFTLRYTASPLVGLEMNYKYTRATQNYIYTPSGTTTPVPFGVQANINETSWGYVAHAPGEYFGIKPFGGVGLGTLRFQPTSAGGQGVLKQYRAAYYWNLGGDYTILGSHFGARAQIRQIFYKAPDFGQNYLTSGTHTSTFEPSIGFFARF